MYLMYMYMCFMLPCSVKYCDISKFADFRVRYIANFIYASMSDSCHTVTTHWIVSVLSVCMQGKIVIFLKLYCRPIIQGCSQLQVGTRTVPLFMSISFCFFCFRSCFSRSAFSFASLARLIFSSISLFLWFSFTVS